MKCFTSERAAFDEYFHSKLGKWLKQQDSPWKSSEKYFSIFLSTGYGELLTPDEDVIHPLFSLTSWGLPVSCKDISCRWNVGVSIKCKEIKDEGGKDVFANRILMATWYTWQPTTTAAVNQCPLIQEGYLFHSTAWVLRFYWIYHNVCRNNL